jgi:diguanylate cyclase (GGDEF)-like protein/PAS domain S-box-containing protein
MIKMTQRKIEKVRRKYNQWVATESLEDYALRYSPSSYRKWPPLLIANTAIGSISFLALEAIGATLLIEYGFTNAIWAITFASLIIFFCSAPIAYYCARYNIDIDLLTRSAGFGYVGSTVTSLIYASFCFIFFALEAAIMAQAFKLYFDLPLYIGYIACSLVIIPLAFYGITLINRLHLWTQPIWLVLMFMPFYFVLMHEPRALDFMSQFSGKLSNSSEFDPYYFGIATGVSLALIAQIGEQVDYLRFMPSKTKENQVSWWFSVFLAGPGWILLGFLKQVGGLLLASLAVLTGVALFEAKEPVQMYSIAYSYVFENQQIALFFTMVYVVISQIKINVTNAYAGSLAWSNFFSRVTHSHPGRVVWLVFNIMIALMLMEIGIFRALEKILGLYSNVAIAWIGAIVADLVINKPLKLSPPMVEFKRAHLFNFNPVGYLSMLTASLLSIIAFTGVLGEYAQAYSSLIALSVSMVLSPIIAKITGGKYYIARQNEHYQPSNQLETCGICEQQYVHTDFAFCTFHQMPICSLCCTLDVNCHDDCKPERLGFCQKWVGRFFTLCLQNKMSQNASNRIANFALIWGVMLVLTGIVLWLTVSIKSEGLDSYAHAVIASSFYQLYFILAMFSSIASWWVVLINESRQLAEAELNEQNQVLADEVIEKQQAEEKAVQLAIKLQHQAVVLKSNYDELTNTYKQLAESETLFRKLVETQAAIVWRAEAKSYYCTFISEQVEHVFGYPVEKWLNNVDFWKNQLHPDDKEQTINYCIEQVRKQQNYEVEYRMISATAEVIWVRDVVNLVIKKGKVTELVGFMIDITQSKADSEKIQYLTDLYLTLSRINHTIIYIDNEEELFSELCNIAVKFGDLGMAWVGVKQQPDNKVVAIASAGEQLDYLDQLDVFIDEKQLLSGEPINRAYFEKRVVTVNQLLVESENLHSAFNYSAYGWASCCAIPILRDKQSFAILNVYSTINDYFSKEIIQLLTELGGDLTFALDSIDRERARHKAEQALELSAKVFAQSQEGIIISDSNNRMISVNEAFTKITGYSHDEVKGKNPQMLSSGRQNCMFYHAMWKEISTFDYWQGEIWNRRKNGEIFPLWMSISVVKDKQGLIVNYIAIFSDISQHKETEARIEHLAHYDPLTLLPNRILLKAYIDHELLVARRNSSQFALLFLDLDHFKNINDSLGHSVGDKLLIEVAHRLKSVVRAGDTVSRLGGDEFNILLPNTDFNGAALVAEKIVKYIAETVLIGTNQLHISSSIGISLFPSNGDDYESLYKNADTALYQAKDNGRNQYQFFTHEMQVLTMRRMEIESHLRCAIKKNELSLFYQPQVDAQSHKIIGAEALLRWHHPVWGMVSPAEFIPVAEDTGLIITIGDWVLEQAISQAKSWHEAGYKELTVAVNLSLAQFSEEILFEKVKKILEHVQLAPQFLELELTESIAMKNAEAAIKITQKLAGLGIQLSVDDFGTGYSSLSYLQRFSLHKLKIDQSFSFKMTENKETENIVNAIISLAQSLGLKTIAEGVETEEQLTMLVEKGCDEIQGYYFSKPVPVDKFSQLLDKERGVVSAR